MKNKVTILLFFLLALAFSPNSKSFGPGGTLHVEVRGLRNSNGWVVCHLFRGEEGFPTNSKKALIYKNDFDLMDSVARFTFVNLEPGVYAFTVHHDENGNKKMDKSFIGIPSEGWACSNNAKGLLGLAIPTFNNAKFEMNDKIVRQEITINY